MDSADLPGTDKAGILKKRRQQVKRMAGTTLTLGTLGIVTVPGSKRPAVLESPRALDGPDDEEDEVR